MAVALVAFACAGCALPRFSGSLWPAGLSRRSSAEPASSQDETHSSGSKPGENPSGANVSGANPSNNYATRESDYREPYGAGRRSGGNSPAGFDAEGDERSTPSTADATSRIDGRLDPNLFLADGDADVDAQPIDGKVIEPAQIVAVVGNQSVQAGDISSVTEQMVAIMLNGKKAADLPEEEQEQFRQMKERMFRSTLQADIQVKLVYLDFLRTLPDRSKVPEVLKSVNAKFEDELREWREKVAKTPQEEIGKRLSENPILTRLSILMLQEKAESLGELESILRQYGSSLDRELRSYAEFKISHEMKRRNVKFNAEITHQQMLDYYREHHDSYAFKAKARWEQLSIYFSRCKSPEEAMHRISEMGNAVYLGGAAFAAVAKRDSHESLAEQGGVHDWTSEGSLASKKLDEAIFTLPLNRLSEIIEDDRGVHIVRVLERTEGGHQSFESVQDSIREKIKGERIVREITQYVERLQKTTYVWTIFDGESGLTEPSSP